MITVNGQYLGNLLKVSQISGRGFLAPQDNIAIYVPGGLGTKFIKSKEEPRILKNTISILYDDMTPVRQAIRIIGSILNAEGLLSIEYNDEPGIVYFGKVSGSTDLDETAIIGKGTLEFECFNPRPVGLDKTFNMVTGQTIIRNEGAAETYPVLTVSFSGPTTSFSISDGDKIVKVIRNFVIGDIVKIDFNTRKILHNGVLSMPLLDLASRWFNLKAGQNTLIVSANSSVVMEYKERWL